MRYSLKVDLRELQIAAKRACCARPSSRSNKEEFTYPATCLARPGHDLATAKASPDAAKLTRWQVQPTNNPTPEKLFPSAI